MSQGERIRTPWKRRWERVRRRVLPLVTFVGSAVLLTWLWQKQGPAPGGIGEVEAIRVDVVAQVDGVLVSLPQPLLTLFERVHEGQVVARLDDRPAQTRLETLRAEIIRLRKTLEVEQARIVLSEADRQEGYLRDVARLAWECEQHRLSALDRQALIEADRVVLQRRQARLDFLTPLHARGMVSDVEFSDEQLLLEEVRKRLDTNTAVLQESQKQQQAAAERLAAFPPLVLAEVNSLLTSVQAAIAVEESRVREVQLEIENLESRAPLAGTVVAVHRYPGQSVRAGDPILTIASEQARYIVSYVPQERGAPPTVGWGVKVRPRTVGSQSRESVVESVGPQIELIPVHQRRNPQVPEWGLPVRVLLPEGLEVRPGELIDVTFVARRGDNPG
ncbi:MAG: HlyD family secretion protein [Pirellulaceae bacterium]|jgi:multidrug resistance efflux pump|nr:HlyD family secretion protein [Pirellulaceae bacterium]